MCRLSKSYLILFPALIPQGLQTALLLWSCGRWHTFQSSLRGSCILPFSAITGLGRLCEGPWHQGRLREPRVIELRGLCNIQYLSRLCWVGARVLEKEKAGLWGCPRSSSQTASVTMYWSETIKNVQGITVPLVMKWLGSLWVGYYTFTAWQKKSLKTCTTFTLRSLKKNLKFTFLSKSG